MALLEGRVTLCDLLEAGEGLPPDAQDRLLEALRTRGVLGGAGSSPSGRDTGEGAEGQTADVPSGMLWGRLPEVPEDEGRRILSALTFAQWKQYRNLRFLGEGGMGRIFKAFDPSLRRMVALKFLRRDAGDHAERFMLEAQNQARVDHPGICKVYEVGTWKGQPYIAMQFIRGTTLEAAALELDLDQKLAVMESVAEAVHAAHRQGLIHRDLKPSNIMVERTEDQGLRATVLDFGLARGMEASGLTVLGVVLGTAHYMAPEQARGENDRLGRRSDVYSLGCTLHAVLAGEPPFGQAQGMECLRRVSEEEVPPLSALVPDLPGDLQTIVMKCLEKDPLRRYESARALAEDLRRFRDQEPILARPPSLLYRMGKRARKHQALVAISGGALLAVMVLGGLFLGARLDASARARHAQHFGQEAERIEALVRYAHLLPAHDPRVELREASGRMEALEAQAARLGPLAEGPGAYALGRGFLALGDPERALAQFRKAESRSFLSPDLHYAWGRTLGLLYQRGLDEAWRIPDAGVRETRIRELGRSLKEPALVHLKAGRGATLEPSGHLEALLAFYEKRFDEALDRARSVFGQRAWFYEAKALEGDILAARAREGQDPVRALPDLERSAAAYREAGAIAPSDPALPLGEARSLREAVEGSEHTGRDPGPAMAACREACGRARRLGSAGGQPEAVLARACATFGRYREVHGQPFREAL